MDIQIMATNVVLSALAVMPYDQVRGGVGVLCGGERERVGRAGVVRKVWRG